MVLAVILSIVVLFGWQFFYITPKLQEAKRIESLQKKALEETVKSPMASDKNALSTLENPIEQNTKIVEIEAKRIKINNDKLHGSISTQGARIDDLTLANYKVDNTDDAPEVVLLSPSGNENVYFAESGWLAAGNDTIVPNSQSVWYSEDDELTKDKPVTLTWDNNAGLKFIIEMAIDDNYMFTITKSVENYGQNSESVIPYGLLNRTRKSDKETFYILHEGALGVLDDVLIEETYADLKDDKKQSYKNASGWIGLTDKYWLTAFVPDDKNSFDTNFTYFTRDGKERYQVDYAGQKRDIAQGDKIVVTSNFFAGAKKVSQLDKYGEKLGIPLFDRAVDFGYLYFITKPIFQLLEVFHNLLGNFGLAILLLTVILKILLFPLANKSYVSMHHLKRLQPQIMELKERYKDDKMAMNKAMMELYKEEKVNPMAGCLPILIQIPIFFALYKVLFVTIEMRHAPFYGWINDLSAKDPTSIFNLFGLIPWDPPSMLMIGAWPVIMCLTMILQQKMNPQPADPVQAKVMKMLPYIFVFVFATFPAGLVIYWAWNNILSILQQWLITRRLPK